MLNVLNEKREASTDAEPDFGRYIRLYLFVVFFSRLPVDLLTRTFPFSISASHI